MNEPLKPTEHTPGNPQVRMCPWCKFSHAKYEDWLAACPIRLTEPQLYPPRKYSVEIKKCAVAGWTFVAECQECGIAVVLNDGDDERQAIERWNQHGEPRDD
jgi:hypothetical protein